MSRYRASEATVTVMPQGSRLLVLWVSAAYFGAIRASFRAELWRHRECVWQQRARAWSVSAVYGRLRLESWLCSTFEPTAVQWGEEA